MEMKTRLPHEELGTLLLVEGSEVKKQEPVACEKGTSISIKNLFYNIPARRNFLKSNGVEMSHITEEFQRLALAHPDLAFALIQNDELLYDLPFGEVEPTYCQFVWKKLSGPTCPRSGGNIISEDYGVYRQARTGQKETWVSNLFL